MTSGPLPGAGGAFFGGGGVVGRERREGGGAVGAQRNDVDAALGVVESLAADVEQARAFVVGLDQVVERQSLRLHARDQFLDAADGLLEREIGVGGWRGRVVHGAWRSKADRGQKLKG